MLLSYHFPPIGGAGVQRSVKLTKHLRAFGYETVVVSGSAEQTSRWTPVDQSLVTEVPRETIVLRARGPEPSSGVGRLSRLLGGSTHFGQWWSTAAVSAAGEAPDVAAVVATMSPFESASAASCIAEQLDVPWIADLRDPWALDEMTVYPTRFHRARALQLMRRQLASAAAITMNTPEACKRILGALPQLGDRPVIAISNGFDADDFNGQVSTPRGDGRFRIVHSGYLHTELGREHRARSTLRRLAGGAAPGVDFLTRSHVYLLQAIDRLAETEPRLAESIDVHLAGMLTRADETAIAGHRVHVHGYLPHDETIALLRTADLLFLPMHDLPVGTRATIVPGKTYEYLAAGTPILAAVPDGDARELLQAAGNADLVRPSDVDAMAEALRRAVDRWQRGEATSPASPFVIARYERHRLASDMASLLDDVIGVSSAHDMSAAPRSTA